MASLMENLIEVLELESREYENLLELSTKKTPVIIAGNLDELAKITDEEQNVVSGINRLDKKRQEVFTDIANVINKDVDTLKIAYLIDMLESRPEEQQKLARVHDRLSKAVHGVRSVNEQNGILIQNALEMVEFDMHMLQAMKAAPETANYDRGAVNAGVTMGVDGRGFDAKQ